MGIPLFWILSLLPLGIQILIAFLVFILAIWTAEAAGQQMGSPDDPRIVIDEIAGYVVAIISIPFTWKTLLASFVLFRIFDVLKPYPIGSIDTHWRTGVGVVVDDVVAGLYTLIVLRVLLFLFPAG